LMMFLLFFKSVCELIFIGCTHDKNSWKSYCVDF